MGKLKTSNTHAGMRFLQRKEQSNMFNIISATIYVLGDVGTH